MYLTVKETADYLKMSENHTYLLIKSKKIPSIKLGGKILINKESLDEMLKNMERKNEK